MCEFVQPEQAGKFLKNPKLDQSLSKVSPLLKIVDPEI